MFVWPSGWIPPIEAARFGDPAERLRSGRPSGRSRRTRPTPSWSRAVIAAGGSQDRLLADVDLADAGDPAGTPEPLSNVLQWQASIEPDLSMTTTSATSGCFCWSRTPMSTGRVSSTGVSW
jgi:hypothetical protein